MNLLFQKFLFYIRFWRKRGADEPTSVYLKMMHGMNRISILLFIVAVIVIIVRYLF
ncbi:MAG: DUF6728 family protein [Bacteroidia bacterium]